MEAPQWFQAHTFWAAFVPPAGIFLVSIMEKRTKGVAGAGVEVAEGWFLKGGGAVWLPANASTPLLFVHACGWRHSISRLASLRLACLWGGGPDKRPTLPQDLLLPNIKSRHQLLISSCDLHAIIDQVCRYGVDIPDCGVYELDLFWEGPFSGCPLEQCPRGKLGLASLIQSLGREDQWSWDQGLQKRLVLGPV